MSSPTNEIKARAKLLSMPFPYLVTLLILLPFFLFRKHSGLVRHNLCGARRRVKWRVRKCAGRWTFLHRKSRLQHSLIPKFFVRGDAIFSLLHVSWKFVIQMHFSSIFQSWRKQIKIKKTISCLDKREWKWQCRRKPEPQFFVMMT
jgi:hypothetical protein